MVVGLALRWRAMAATIKGVPMGAFGLWVLGVAGWHSLHSTVPEAETMGVIGFAALAANVAGVPPVTITFTPWRTKSAAIEGNRSLWSSAQRYSMITLRPST